MSAEPIPEFDVPGPERVKLRFLQSGEDRAVKEARVLAGTTVFDAASWNGVAIDSTCGGHGTCKKCKVRVVSGHAPISSVDPRAFTTEELKGGWRLACRSIAQEDLTIEVPPLQTRPKAALVGVGRHVILRPAVQKRYLELTEPTLEDQTSDLERVLAGMDDMELRVPLAVHAHARQDAARVELERHRRALRRRADRRRAGRHVGAAACARVRPRHDHRRRDADEPRDRAAGSGAVDPQQAAAVRRRRDHAHLGDDDGSRRADDAA